jgi:hypothetical protein
MEVKELAKKFGLTPSQLDQLQVYVEWAEDEGCYYGNRKQFTDRHCAIRNALGMKPKPPAT